MNVVVDPGMLPVTQPPPSLRIKLGRCIDWRCDHALIPPGNLCCWAHASDFGDEEATPVVTVRR